MRLIKQQATFIKQERGIPGIYKQIEFAARNCYKSNNRRSADSAEAMVERMKENKHAAMLEHGAVYLTVSLWRFWIVLWYVLNPYSKVHTHGTTAYISTNYRVIFENDKEGHLDKFMKNDNLPTDYHEHRLTIFGTTCIHVYKDCTRHRTFSFAIESTRFCNYLKEKFGAALKFVIPTWLSNKLKPEEYKLENSAWRNSKGEVVREYLNDDVDLWLKGLRNDEKTYLKLINKYGWTAQEAASKLPQETAADVVMTAFESDWKHFMSLRFYGRTGKPLPQVQEFATLARTEILKNHGDCSLSYFRE